MRRCSTELKFRANMLIETSYYQAAFLVFSSQIFTFVDYMVYFIDRFSSMCVWYNCGCEQFYATCDFCIYPREV